MFKKMITLESSVRRWLTFICIVGTTIIVQAQPLKTWNGSVSSNWAEAANWTPAAVPIAGDSVVIKFISGKPSPIIQAGTVAKAKNVNLVFTNLTVAVGGQLELASSLNVTAFVNNGELVNNGTITIKSGFCGIYNQGELYNNGTLLLGDANATPYAFKEDAICMNSIFTNLEMTNSSTGNIVIRRAGNNGILINDDDEYVVFTNHGQISISETGLSENPVVAATGDGIDLSSGVFTNETSGVIQISKVSANGIYCRASNQCSNKGSIKLEDVGRTTELQTREGIYNNGVFTNYATGQIGIEKASNNGILNTNTFTNSGAINIGVLFPASIGNMGLANFAQSPIVEANFVNESGASLTIRNVTKTGIITAGAFQPGEVSNKAGATISIDQTELYGVEVVGLAGFDNAGLLQIGLNGSIREYGIRNGFEFANQQTGEIIIQNTGEAAIYNAVSPITAGFLSKFRSAGRISIGQADQAGDVAVYNDNQCTFELLGCKSLLHLLDNNTIGNDGTFSNQGNIIENANNESRISTNSGVIQNLNGGNFLVTGSNTGAVVTASGLLWTGCFDTNWNADYNWNTVTVPTATDVVVIPNVNNDPVIEAGVNAFAKSVQVLPDAALTIQEKLILDGAEHYSLYNQGSVTNNGTVLIGQATGGGAHGIRNAATFLNNTNAEIFIDKIFSNATDIGIGLWNESGTFTNKAEISLGANSSAGVRGLNNNAQFQNDLGGSIQIDRTTESALMNNNGVFNNAAKIVIGSKGGSLYGLRNYAEFNNNAHGDISIDAAYNTGVRNDAGTFNNAAQLTIGAVYDVGENGIMNYANFNHTAGEIRIDRSTFAGIRTSGGTFTNAAKIVIGALASTGKIGIFIGSPFNNNAGGDIRIDRATRSGIEVNNKTFTNAAKITIGAGAGITGDGIHNQDNFYNNAGGEIKIDQTTNTGIFNEKYFPADPGNFVNTGNITIGATASTGLHGIYNSGLFQNNNGGELAIDRNSLHGIKNIIGTFENTGDITIGGLSSTGDYGVYNDAVFQNNTNAQLRIARSVKEALHNHEGATFHNRAEIIIGAEHPAGDYGIFNFGAFNNHPDGDISIDRCVKSGLFNRQGDAVEFHNYANLVIGGKASTGEHGIHNFETFENHEGGSIDIDNCMISGLENVYGTFTNAALLRVGTSVSPGQTGIVNLGTLQNEPMGSIYVNRSTQYGLSTISLFRNRGQVHIGDQMSIGNTCLNNTGTVENLDGAIYLNRSSTQALLSVSSFTNAALLSVGNLGNIGNTGIDNRGFFDNTATGDIHIESYTVEGFYNRSETTNSGQIIISGSDAANSYGLRNITSFKKFTNAACGVIRMSAPLFNLGAFENAGLISATTNAAHFNSTGLTNNGILEYPQGNPIPNVTNNDVIVQPVTGECPVANALQVGSSNNFTISTTWYKNANLTMPAGTYDAGTNTFTTNGLADGSTTTLYFTVSDGANGCTRTVSIRLTYDDVTRPTIACPVDTTLNTQDDGGADCAVTLTYTATFTDNCDGTGPATYVSGPASGSSLSVNGSPYTVIYTYTDKGGNTVASNCTFTVTVKDNTLPTFTCPTPPLVLNTNGANGCSVTIPDLVNMVNNEADNCALRTTSPVTQSVPAGAYTGAAHGQTIPVTVTVWDNASPANSTACTITFTVNDDDAPSITCPSNIARNSDPNQCSAVAVYADPSFSDNCTASLTRTSAANTASGLQFPIGTTNIAWKATDAAGNSAFCSFTVTVTDVQAPSIVCPANIIRSTDVGQCGAIVAYTNPTYSDNCLLNGPAGLNHLMGGLSNSTFQKGTTAIIWQATDGVGLTATCSFTITVNDTQKPSITCPANQTRSTNLGMCSAVVTYPMPTGSDNCGLPAGQPIWVSGGTNASGNTATFQKGINTVTWRATDAAGNTQTCTFRVTVNDTQAPTMTCPAAMSLSTTVNTCNAVATYTNPTFTDNCMPISGTSTRISGLMSGMAFPLGSSNVVFQATDAAGNTRRCTMVVTVTDNQPPVVNCPASVVVTGTNSPCIATVFYGSTTASDNCAGTLTPFLVTGLASGSQFPVGVTTNTFRAVAPNGQSAECSFSVTVNCGSGMGNNGVEVRNEDLSVQHSDNLDLTLAPNPALSTVTVSIEGVGAGGGTLLVFDAVGRLVLRQVIAEQQQTAVFQVDGAEFAPSMYRVNLRTENGMVTKTLVVVK
jgi:HYR domain